MRDTLFEKYLSFSIYLIQNTLPQKDEIMRPRKKILIGGRANNQ